MIAVAILVAALAAVAVIIVDAVLFDAEDADYWEGEPPQPVKHQLREEDHDRNCISRATQL